MKETKCTWQSNTMHDRQLESWLGGEGSCCEEKPLLGQVGRLEYEQKLGKSNVSVSHFPRTSTASWVVRTRLHTVHLRKHLLKGLERNVMASARKTTEKREGTRSCEQLCISSAGAPSLPAPSLGLKDSPTHWAEAQSSLGLVVTEES